ncbi:MAG: 4Fe-4S dicluster domain-containing protein [Methanomassiliicoccales archaeon]|jgi:heterodisulfide reductase subunit C|nr:4Fe-4S dicluster domain-containing protein [Methanomassiliicoccales archaeon]
MAMGRARKEFITSERERLLEEVPIVDEECNRDFIKAIIEMGGGDVQVCLQCGNCTGVCPVSLKTENKIRNIIKMCQMGLKEKVLSTPWVCATCHRCYEHCPAGMNPAELIVALRHIVVRELGPPPFVVSISNNVANLGQAVEISDEILNLRKKIGLNEKPFDERYRSKAIMDLKTIMKATGYDKLIGIDLGD